MWCKVHVLHTNTTSGLPVPSLTGFYGMKQPPVRHLSLCDPMVLALSLPIALWRHGGERSGNVSIGEWCRHRGPAGDHRRRTVPAPFANWNTADLLPSAPPALGTPQHIHPRNPLMPVAAQVVVSAVKGQPRLCLHGDKYGLRAYCSTLTTRHRLRHSRCLKNCWPG